MLPGRGRLLREPPAPASRPPLNAGARLRGGRQAGQSLMCQTVAQHKAWLSERLPVVDARLGVRLCNPSAWLGDADWPDGEFSAGDLPMIRVLHSLSGPALLAGYPNRPAYVASAGAEPAFRGTFASQPARAQSVAPDLPFRNGTLAALPRCAMNAYGNDPPAFTGVDAKGIEWLPRVRVSCSSSVA